VESKEAARSTESDWSIRKQALHSEHQLELKRASGAQSSRISQLEGELERVKAELEHANSQIQTLNEQLGEDSYDSRPSRREEKKAAKPSFTASIPEVGSITISAKPEPEPQRQSEPSSSVDIDVSASAEEAAF